MCRCGCACLIGVAVVRACTVWGSCCLCAPALHPHDPYFDASVVCMPDAQFVCAFGGGFCTCVPVCTRVPVCWCVGIMLGIMLCTPAMYSAMYCHVLRCTAVYSMYTAMYTCTGVMLGIMLAGLVW